MATVSLQTVFDAARQSLETGAADKAIGIAQHILVHFPRMIEGQRLLGEAYLNANQPEQAAAAFEQVLQADPENVAAYYGLGLARQSLEQRPAAITAFERALEIQPNLADLRTQLMRLYAETPGAAGQFRLSRAGLGRLYARGGMYGQAIDEFRAVLDTEPQRDDVNVALAEALWRDGQEDEAIDFCRDVLDRRAELLKPTVLLGYMLFASGQPEGEGLWRRASEQDATMTMAHSLFDILPPIRVEDPVLPEFDEAEWRAQAARRAAEQAVPTPVAASAASDDDFFADSWLSATPSTVVPNNNVRIYDAEPAAPVSATPSMNDDDDLLASLLGFADMPSQAAATPSEAEISGVQPFGFDDWSSDTSSDLLPVSLNDIALPDEKPASEAARLDESVKPFSMDDWDFEDDVAPQAASSSAPTPAREAPADDFGLSGVEAFSFEDDEPQTGNQVKPFNFEATTETSANVQPFSFEENIDPPSEVQPFSLDDETDQFGDVRPFSFEDDSRATSAAPTDAGLGAVQPFSFEEWGLDDTEPTLPTLNDAATDRSAQLDEFGDFKPFSLDELSLDSLDNETDSSLTGPQISDTAEATDEPTGFSWEEPSWRTQPSSGSSAVDDDASIFAKLMRNRQSDAPPAVPVPSEQENESNSEDETFFSLDDVSLRLDDAADGSAGVSSQTEVAPVVENAESLSESMPTSNQATATNELDASDLWTGLFDTDAESSSSNAEISAELGGTVDSQGMFDEPFSWEQNDLTQVVVPDAEQDTTPFSLSDLGFDNEDLAPRENSVEASSTALEGSEQATDADMTPFSLSDLGLSDDEIAALNLEDSEDEQATPVVNEDAASTSWEQVSPDAPTATPATATTEDSPDFTPFSLADLGLTDEDLELLDQQPSTDEVPAASLSGSHPEEVDFEEPVAAGEATPAPEQSEAAERSYSELVWPDFQSELNNDIQSETVEMSVSEELDQVEAKQSGGASVEGKYVPSAGADEPDLTPFSLADLGLNDEERQFLEQAQQDQPSVLETDEPTALEFAVTPFEEVDNTQAVDSDAAIPMDSEHPAQADQADELATPFGTTALTPSAVDASSGISAVDALADTPAAQNASEVAKPIASGTSAPSLVESPRVDTPMAQGLAGIHAQLAADPENDAMRLAFARMSQQMNDIDQAADQYKYLIKRGQLLDEVVDDLQDAIADYDDPIVLRRLHRLLGDAFMKQNRFREAMDEYSWTLARRG